MKIGRLVRQNQGRTHIGTRDKCLSACVLVMVSGVYRFASGQVGVHRPYFEDLKVGNTALQIRQKIDILNATIANYLNEMDIPLSLLDVMKSVPAEEVKILGYEEIKLYGIGGVDATTDEKDISEAASKYGTSSSEYRKRKASADRLCGRSLDAKGDEAFRRYHQCMDSQLYGLTISEYQARTTQAVNQCRHLFPDGPANMTNEKMRQLEICMRKIYTK